MKIGPRLFLSGAWLGLAACAGAVPETSPPPAAPIGGAETITPTDMYARVSFLASDALRGRATPSPGLEAAAAYLVSEYERLGLAPAGEDGTFYQWYPYPLRRLSAEGTRLRTTAPGGIRDLVLGRDYYASGGTPAAVEAALVFTGTGIATADGGAGALRDKIAVAALPGDGRSREWRLLRRRQAEQAKAAGALALVHVLDPGWTPAQIGAAAERAGAPARSLGQEPAFPEIYLSYEAARPIFAAGGLELDALWREAVAGTVEPVTLSGISVSADVRQLDLDRSLAPNVAAVLPGSDPELRDEYVILSAHLDHVGVGEPVNGDSIYNGADDDASGTAALVEVAEALASLPERPRRSIIFLHVSGEEHGLLGSRWYSDHPTVPLERIVANINVDMIGRNAPDSVVVIGKDYSSLGRVVNAVAAEHPEVGLVVADDIWPEERFFFRSDHFNFARKEVPALFFFSGVHEDYHRPSDEVDKLNVGKAARVAQLIYHTTREIANDPEVPVWDPAGLAEVRSMTR